MRDYILLLLYKTGQARMYLGIDLGALHDIGIKG
jgi:hypothetical protein